MSVTNGVLKIMNVVDNKPENSKEAVSNRRKFLVKGSAAALIVSLPAKSTWATTANGCTVSGNLSGNLSQACTTTNINGASPTAWLSASSEKSRLKGIKWKNVFSTSPTGNEVGRNSSLYRVLKRGSEIDKNLVAGYLNAEAGFYPLSVDVTPADYALMLEDEAMNDQGALLEALNQTYTR
ncbi:hypothetical protein [Paraglaciecola agarilytica]|uniref:hypothetical protein n=1 Tax=Paraglaciecola chathamensis TaxID=368405 RepID=UPI002353F177|nr:hypothetical protein [Paraglaciecola agarilytica]|tara:strand:+ start:53326 stop:53868 length:543 start_codon:yes stop_codon:yes gene_type:complete